MSSDSFEFTQSKPITIAVGTVTFTVQPSDMEYRANQFGDDKVLVFIDRNRNARFAVSSSKITFISQPL